MRSMIVSVFAFLVAFVSVPERADACGVKLTARATNVTLRSANPSTVHLIGVEEESSLRRALRRAGHNVVVTREPSEVSGARAVVLTSQTRENVVRRTIPQGIVLVETDSVRQTLEALERRLASQASDLES